MVTVSFKSPSFTNTTKLSVPKKSEFGVYVKVVGAAPVPLKTATPFEGEEPKLQVKVSPSGSNAVIDGAFAVSRVSSSFKLADTSSPSGMKGASFEARTFTFTVTKVEVIPSYTPTTKLSAPKNPASGA